MRRSPGACVRLRELPPLRLGILRVTSRQLDLLPSPDSGGRAWTVLDERQRGTRFLALAVRSVLNTSAATGMGFWSINPYVGCEFGCTYCYARDTHRYAVERSGAPLDPLPAWEAFERRILVKTGVAETLARTLDPGRLGEHSLVIGTATDPYQPAERRFRLTRQILEVLLGYRGLAIGVITKSPLVTRDIDLLRRLAERHEVTVNISLATLDRPLARRLELRSPVPEARIRALGRLTAAGIHAGLLIAPIVPGVTDDRHGLGRLMGAAKEAGARYVVGSALRLGPAARQRFLPVLAREFPELAERYARHYARSEGASPAYQRALAARLRELQHQLGFPVDEGMKRRHQLEGRDRRMPAATDQPLLL
ncbi:MAG TPA: radical SAM protein [Gemmatimonadales bacterium]|nr:radical SAM protein [Gemmatimonadales bacterium]